MINDAPLRQIRLPDGTEIWTPRAFDALMLFRELVEDAPLGRHGVDVPAGGTIFDVGANIGLFAIAAARTASDVRVHCFEPVALLFDALERNLAIHLPSAIAHRVALGRQAGTASIVFDPYSTVTGSMYPDVFRRAAAPGTSVLAWARAGLADLERVEPGTLTRALRRGLENPWTAPPLLAALLPVAAFLAVRARIFTRRQPCDVRRLSDALQAHGRAPVDLVKIDVEGAEEDVLLGIDDDDWPLLRQFIIEVHDVDGRLDRMAALLEARGYHTVRHRQPWALHVTMNIWTLFARGDDRDRPPCRTPPASAIARWSAGSAAANAGVRGHPVDRAVERGRREAVFVQPDARAGVGHPDGHVALIGEHRDADDRRARDDRFVHAVDAAVRDEDA